MNQPQFTFTNLTVNDWLEVLTLVHSTKTKDVERLRVIIARYADVQYTAPTILEALNYITIFIAAMDTYVDKRLMETGAQGRWGTAP